LTHSSRICSWLVYFD